MRMVNKRARTLVVSVGAAALILGAVTAAVGQSERRTVRDGVFTAEQVERGERSFGRVCIDCHELAEFTGPGADLERKEGEPLWSVFDYISSEMPEDRPAWLEPSEYADILAYIFSVYGLPSGPEPMPMTRQELRRITITRPELPGS